MLGAIREDDVPFDSSEPENTPQDDPDGAFYRVFRHFFDPYGDRGLAFGPIQPGARAVDWALQWDDDVAIPETGEVQVDRGNHFSIAKAREAMWRALTLKTKPAATSGNAPLPDLPFTPSADLPTRESLRTAYWATTFRALGDVVHLIQDMAQPQHTRNAPHAGRGCVMGSCFIGGHKSYFEAYVEARVVGRSTFALYEGLNSSGPTPVQTSSVALAPPEYSGYAIPRFHSYRDYFATAVGRESLTGKGLANYSNRGFYAVAGPAGGVDAGAYPSPPPNPFDLPTSLIPANAVEDAAGLPVRRGSLLLLLGDVKDFQDDTRTEHAVPLASFGSFDAFMKTSYRQFTLNHYNYSQQTRLLIPRAVAYSAGLLDYFFRGRLEISPPKEGIYAIVDHATDGCAVGCGFGTVKLRVRNATAGEAFGTGVLVAVAKYRPNRCYSPDLAGEPGGEYFEGYENCGRAPEEIAVSDAVALPGLATGSTVELAFRFSKPIPISATDLSLQLVFRGNLGTEPDAVVVETKDIGEPAFIGVANTTDYVYDPATSAYRKLPFGGYTKSDDSRLLSLKFGDPISAPTIARIDRLGPGQHAQVAYLADKGVLPVTYAFAATGYTALSPLTLSLPTAQFESNPALASYTSNMPVAKARGVYRQTYLFASYPADGTFRPCPGQTGDFCTQATMPALTRADIVPWTIAFGSP